MWCVTSAKLWWALHQTYSASSHARLFKLCHQLQRIVKEGLSYSNYLHKMRVIDDELAFTSHPINNDDLIILVLNEFGLEFNAFTIPVTTSSHQDPMSSSDLHSMLLSHEALLFSQLSPSSTLPSPDFTAFFSHGPWSEHKPNSQFKSSRPNKPKPNIN